MSRRIVFVELNEVPWRVLDDFAAEHPDSTIARLVPLSEQYTTVAPDSGHLSPWVTWPTVHRGVPDDDHGFSDLGQDRRAADERFPATWELAVRAGFDVGVFGPLHTHPLPDDVERYAFWLPDTFAPDDAAHPASLSAFQSFNLAMARASARNVDTSIDLRRAASFLVRSPALGLRPATIAAVLAQLRDERREPWTRVRRRSLQSVLAFDLFVHQLKRHRPALSVVFTNHVASAMHRYWAATYADDFDAESYGFEPEWRQRYAGEIDVAMGHADRFLGRLTTYVERDPRHLLVVASSMGQAAAQSTPVRELLLLRDAERLVAAAGVRGAWERRPAMDPMVSLALGDDARPGLLELLERLRVGGRPVEHRVDDAGLVSIQFGQADDAIGQVTVGDDVVDPADLGLERVVVEDEAGSSGYHVPEGSLWVYDPRRSDRRRSPERPPVPTTAIAPAVLEALGAPPADHHTPHPDLRLVPPLVRR